MSFLLPLFEEKCWNPFFWLSVLLFHDQQSSRTRFSSVSSIFVLLALEILSDVVAQTWLSCYLLVLQLRSVKPNGIFSDRLVVSALAVFCVSAGLCLQVKLQRCLPFKHKVSNGKRLHEFCCFSIKTLFSELSRSKTDVRLELEKIRIFLKYNRTRLICNWLWFVDWCHSATRWRYFRISH